MAGESFPCGNASAIQVEEDPVFLISDVKSLLLNPLSEK